MVNLYKYFTMAALTVIAGLGCLSPEPESPTPGPFQAGIQSLDTNTDFFIVNSLTGACLDVIGAPGTANGTRLETYPCELSGIDAWGGPSDQVWFMDNQGLIKNKLSPDKCIDVVGAPGSANGTPLQLYTCEVSGYDAWGNRTDQRWDYTGGFFKNRLSGSRKCIDVDGGPAWGNHRAIQLWDCEIRSDGGPAVTDQLWTARLATP